MGFLFFLLLFLFGFRSFRSFFCCYLLHGSLFFFLFLLFLRSRFWSSFHNRSFFDHFLFLGFSFILFFILHFLSFPLFLLFLFLHFEFALFLFYSFNSFHHNIHIFLRNISRFKKF